MNKLRVFQNVYKRRKPYGYGILLLLFLFLPYLITVLLGNGRKNGEETEMLMVMEQLKASRYTVVNETAVGRESIPLELYVADKLMRTMGEEYEQEALKAQAILLRAEMIPDEGMSVAVSDESYGKEKTAKACLIAVAQTRGIYPEYEGKPVYGAYCKVTGGSTRSASEVLQTQDYPYLSPAVCERDFLCPEYAKTIPVRKEEWEAAFAKMEKAEVLEKTMEWARKQKRYEKEGDFDLIRDSAGYVLFIRYRDKWVEGEALRYALGLPSSSFQIEEEENEILFQCKGVGHGLGMSQFGANEMALAGKNYIEILQYFFDGITFSKIE